MKMVMTATSVGLASLALLSASAEPADAGIWIGLEDSRDGFLLDEDTGQLWMTGACLRALEPASREGPGWVSRTSEMVSVGRMMAVLDQTFRLETDPVSPRITVYNPTRGGRQEFTDVERIDCRNGACARFQASATCED